jgi:hypothetical protein
MLPLRWGWRRFSCWIELSARRMIGCFVWSKALGKHLPCQNLSKNDEQTCLPGNSQTGLLNPLRITFSTPLSGQFLPAIPQRGRQGSGGFASLI